MAFIDLAKSRRSVRSFNDAAISEETVNSLLEAAVWAPSAGNKQIWRFVAITNKDVIAKLYSDGVYSVDWITQAGVVIAVCIDKTRCGDRYGVRGEELYCFHDTGAAVQNILLCAHDMGMGACWIGAFDEKRCSDLLGLDKNIRPVALVPVGYTDAPARPGTRKPMAEVVSYIK